MSNGQIRFMQTVMNRRLVARGRPKISVDGELGPETREAVHVLKYLLGFPTNSLDTGPSLWFRRVIQHPNGLRPPSYLARARARAEYLKKQENKQTDSPRLDAVRWARAQAGTTESPAGSNRGGKITEWQQALGAWLVGTAWCGEFAGAVLRHVGVQGVNYRIASVAYIEDDAKAHRGPFRGWTTDPHQVMRGDLVILFGRGVHVEVVDSIDYVGHRVYTIGGNTSSGSAGSQSNGGGVFRRVRSFSDVHGFALVNYPG